MNIRSILGILSGFILLFTFITIESAAGLNIKFRAREHFVDRHRLTFADGSSAKYSGLSNTVNIWHEVPFEYSIGLSISPIIGVAKPLESNQRPLGEDLQLQVYGMEWKYFPVDELKAFTRLGFGYTRLKGDGRFNGVDGHSFYGGLGWEFKVWKAHLAPEFAWRKSNLAKDVSVDSFIFSLGLHFYAM